MKTIGIALLVCCLAIPAFATTYGITSGVNFIGARQGFDQSGAQTLRIPINWNQIEPSKGNYQWATWDAGLRQWSGVPLTVTYRAVSPWGSQTIAGANPHATLPPLNLDDYCATLWQLAYRSRGLVVRWQIENEEESDYWWAGTMDQYLALFARACATIKDADPQAKVTMGGLTSETLTFSSLYDAGWPPARIAAALGTTYTGGVPAGNLRLRANALQLLAAAESLGADEVDGHLYHGLDTLDERVAWLRSHTTLPIICTETGGPDSKVATYSDQANAEEVVKRFAIEASLGLGETDWLGLMEVPDTDRFRVMGLLHPDLTAKPSYSSYQTCLEMVGNSTFVASEPQGGVSVYHFSDGTTRTRVLWAPSATTVSLNVSGPTAVLVDLYGTPTTVRADLSGKVRVNVGPTPEYLAD